MTRLKIGVIDLRTNTSDTSLFSKLMFANMAGIMPQVVAVWCQDAGHDVHFVCYIGGDPLSDMLPEDLDVLFISAFTQAAQLAYAVSAWARRRGIVTVLGGPHALCYPTDAQRYFDYVVGYTSREIVLDILAERAPASALGQHHCNGHHPPHLPGVRERWPIIEQVLTRAPRWLHIVPMIGSLGCPYSCGFCIDAEVDYQPLPREQISEDLAFLRTRYDRPIVSWYDPNFGVRFDETMDLIERAGPPGSFAFIAESSLAIAREDRLERMGRLGFVGLMPGIETWHDLGRKNRVGGGSPRDKVRQVAHHVNTMIRHVDFVQTNFVLGLDSDQGAEPFELTKEFLDLCPGAFPGYSLLSAFGSASPLNRELQDDDRVLPVPFHLLNNNLAMNVRPAHYRWVEFYDHIVDLVGYSFGPRQTLRRFRAQRHGSPLTRWMTMMRAISAEGQGRLRYHRQVRQRLRQDPELIAFVQGETTRVPTWYADRIKRDLGPLWEHLPAGALDHDPNTFAAQEEAQPTTVSSP